MIGAPRAAMAVATSASRALEVAAASVATAPEPASTRDHQPAARPVRDCRLLLGRRRAGDDGVALVQPGGHFDTRVRDQTDLDRLDLDGPCRAQRPDHVVAPGAA